MKFLQEERHHAQRALSIMMNIQWKNNYFEAIDPVEARRILDEELYGMERVKQRIIETIIQINRTHTLPAYGLLADRTCRYWQIPDSLCSCKNPETSVDYAGHELNQRLQSSLPEAPVFTQMQSPVLLWRHFPWLVPLIWYLLLTSLIRQHSGKGNGNPADVLLTLLDNLGFTDNYMECMIPTGGVYPIATANDQ